MIGPIASRLFIRSASALFLAVLLAPPHPVRAQLVPGVDYSTSWLGNTYGKSGRSDGKWVQQWIHDLWVKPDGRVYANSQWDEGGREAGIYQNGDVIGKMLGDMHSWLGGRTVAGNATYVWLGQKGGYVRRYYPSGATAGDRVTVTAGAWGPTGLAASETELYISCQPENLVKVYGASSMTFLRSFAVNNPGKLAVAPDGTLWVIDMGDADTSPIVRHVSNTGVSLGHTISGDFVVVVAFDNQGRLMVGDHGESQQVMYYNVSGTPTLVDTLGVAGGILSGTPGLVAPDKFNGITGLGTDSAGNLYVSCNGMDGGFWGYRGTELRCFSPSKQLLWELHGLEFVDCADADPVDPEDVYTVHERFRMDYTQTTPGGEWTYQSYTVDPVAYPDDPRVLRGLNSVQVVRMGGQRFLYMNDMDGTAMCVFRFNGEIAVPAVMWQFEQKTRPATAPTTQRWLWVDQNGNGQFDAGEYDTGANGSRDGIAGCVDSAGTVWRVKWGGEIVRYPCSGLNAYGVPVYAAASATSFAKPPLFSGAELTQAHYEPSSDTMFLAGYTTTYPDGDSQYIPLGRVVARYDGWTTDATTADMVYVLPYNAASAVAKSMSVAGDYLFVGYAKAEQVVVFDIATGVQVGALTPGAEINYEHGDLDIPYGIQAVRRANGEYLVFHEDDRYAKIVVYRWLPPVSTVAAPAFAPAAGTYTSAQSVTIANATSGASIRYTTNGTTPTPTAGTLYSGPVSIAATTTLKAIAYKSGMTDSSVTTGTYTISPVVAAPTFAPAPGTYTSAQSVTIASATSGASIRYTTDGSTPTATSGTLYSGPVSIAASATLKAIAYKSGMTDSAVTSGIYTIQAVGDSAWIATVTSGNWSESAKWSAGVPSAVGDIARLGAVSGGRTTVLDQSGVKVGQLVNEQARTWTIGKHANNHALALQSGGGAATIRVKSAGTVSLTVNPDLAIASDLVVRCERQDAQTQSVSLNGTLTGTGHVTAEFVGAGNNAAGNITIASIGTTGSLLVQGDKSANGYMTAAIGAIGSGVSALTKKGTCRLFLTAANAHGGGTTIDRGLVQVRADGGLGSGDVSLVPVTATTTTHLPQLEFGSALVPANGIIDTIADTATLTLQRAKSGSTYYYSTLLFSVSGATERVGTLVFRDDTDALLAEFASGTFNRTTPPQSGIDFSLWFAAGGNVGSIEVATGGSGGQIVGEPFDYTLGANLVGANGGVGFGSGWAVMGTPAPAIAAVSPLSFSDYPMSGNAMGCTIAASGTWGTLTMGRDIGAAADAGSTLWCSYLFRLNSQGTSGMSMRMGFGDLWANVKAAYNAQRPSVRYAGVETTTPTFGIALNVNYLVIGKFTNVNAAGGGSGRLWLLTSSEYDVIKAGGITESELDAQSVCAVSVTSATQANFAVGGKVQFLISRAANQNAVNLTLDELRAGADLADLF